MSQTRRNRWLAGMGCVVAGIAVWSLFDNQTTSGFESGPALPQIPASGPTTAPVPPSILAGGRYLGAGSCAAAGCHGGNGTRGVERSEYSIWIERDRHASAYTILFGAKSQQIARNLNIPAADKDASCLACHALQAPRELSAISHQVLVSDGVSCEACHGPAEKWLQPHVLPSWKRLSSSQRAATGFISGRHDLLRRVEQCADCHIGGPGRDVNHDLIAAGHPRLNFESAAYFAKMPRHWVGRFDEARLWALGRVVAAEKSVQLLADRAAHGPAWPEFAEYECFACHHDLRASETRRLAIPGGKPGQLVWNTWNVSLLPSLAQDADLGTANGQDIAQGLKALDDGLARFEDRAKLAETATSLAAQLRGWGQSLNGKQLTPEQIRRLMTHAATTWSADNDRWDDAAQRYLALVALRIQLESPGAAHPPASTKSPLKQQLELIRKKLQFPQGFDSPHAPARAGSEAPADDEPNVNKLFQRVGELVK